MKEEMSVENSKKTVLHLLASNKYAGAENMVCQIIDCFKDEFNMVYCSPRGRIEEKLQKEEIKYKPIKKISILELKKVIDEVKPDIIHAHDFKASIVTAFSLGNYRKISHLHQSPRWIKKINFKSLLYNLTTLFYNKIIIVSKGIENNFIFNNNKTKDKTVILNNYVDSESVINKSLAEDKESLDLIFVGRLEQVKNPIEFINIIYKIKQKYPNIKAAMLGSGSLFDECNNIIKEKNLTHNIQLLGYKENPYPYILKSKILISTSREEGLGLSIIEGILLDNVVLSTDTDGVQEILQTNYWGICDSTDEFVKKAIELINDSEKHRNVLEYSKKQIEKYTNKEAFKKELREIYTNNN